MSINGSFVLLVNALLFGGGNGAPTPPETPRPGPTAHAQAGGAATLQGSGCEPAMACVALAVYKESTGESFLGQVAVAEVIRNRVYDRMKSPCEVVSEEHQFDGITKYVVGSKPWVKDPVNWIKAMIAAELVFEYKASIPQCEVPTYFFRSEVNKEWTRRVVHTCRVGDHIFARD